MVEKDVDIAVFKTVYLGTQHVAADGSFEAVRKDYGTVERTVDIDGSPVAAVEAHYPGYVVTLVETECVPDGFAVVADHHGTVFVVLVVGTYRCVEVGKEGVGCCVQVVGIGGAVLRILIRSCDVGTYFQEADGSEVGGDTAGETLEVGLQHIALFFQVTYGSEYIEFLGSAGCVDVVFLTVAAT